jgi:predicted phage replisome organizer
MSENKKYYWLKLKRDFFKRHDIRIIEALENGKDYLLFYLKLLVESIDHEGSLRFSDTVPYSDLMLATITNTNVDIVRTAVKVFSELGMMEQMDDGTLFFNHVKNMIGDETEWAEQKRKYREQKQLENNSGKETESRQKKTMSYKSKSKSKSKESEPTTNCPEADNLALLLFSLHQEEDAKFLSETDKRERSLIGWAKDIEKLNRIDGRSWEDIQVVIKWAKTPGNFWFANVQSGAALRKQFDRLFLEARKAGALTVQKPTKTLTCPAGHRLQYFGEDCMECHKIEVLKEREEKEHGKAG